MNHLIEKIHDLRKWEIENLQGIEGIEHFVFLTISVMVKQKKTNLTEVYRSFKYSESTVRLCIRKLEKLCLIKLNKGLDQRFKEIQLTKQGEKIIKQWEQQVKVLFNLSN